MTKNQKLLQIAGICRSFPDRNIVAYEDRHGGLYAARSAKNSGFDEKDRCSLSGLCRPGAFSFRCVAVVSPAQGQSQIQFLTKPCCPVMSVPFHVDRGDDFLSSEALFNPPPFDCARTAVEHDGLALNLVNRLKYGDRTELAPWMANVDGTGVAGDLVDGCDYVVPVPLHRWRFWRRGYNQSAELARVIAQVKGKRFCPEMLIRKKHTRSQVGLGKKEREKNVRSAFIVPRLYRPMLKGMAISCWLMMFTP